MDHNIEEETLFKLRVKYVICNIYRIITKIKVKYWITSHKFGIQVHKTVDEAYKIDHQTGTNFWGKAIKKDVANVCVTFEVLYVVTTDQMRYGKVKQGFKYVRTHIILILK